MANKPYVRRVKVIRIHVDAFCAAKMWVQDKKTGREFTFSIMPHHLPADLERSVNAHKEPEITVWRGTNHRCRYMAYKDELIPTFYMDYNQPARWSKLDSVTQQHLDEYSKKLNVRLAKKKCLSEIQAKIVMIEAIKAKSNAEIEHAKKVLSDYLEIQAQKLHNDLAKYR